MQPWYDVLTIFSSQHIVWFIKSWTHLFINLLSFVKFCNFVNNSIRVYPIKLKIDILDHINNTFWNTDICIYIYIYIHISYMTYWLSFSASIFELNKWAIFFLIVGRIWLFTFDVGCWIWLQQEYCSTAYEKRCRYNFIRQCKVSFLWRGGDNLF